MSTDEDHDQFFVVRSFCTALKTYPFSRSFWHQQHLVTRLHHVNLIEWWWWSIQYCIIPVLYIICK